ncbi:unnamed protein product [Linum trigynum]|uniref:Uncharacterized protein n=1 Tax=Linum trigynum TaxID=586398 RepID=A0AAV2CSY2_9ROSI
MKGTNSGMFPLRVTGPIGKILGCHVTRTRHPDPIQTALRCPNFTAKPLLPSLFWFLCFSLLLLHFVRVFPPISQHSPTVILREAAALHYRVHSARAFVSIACAEDGTPLCHSRISAFLLGYPPPKQSDRAQVQSKEVRLPDSPPISLDDQDVQIVCSGLEVE